jgi:DNA-directed RNA polymerase specialized sigma24 family protein
MCERDQNHGEKMTRTFEEMAGRELDSLYQGALFLTGGNARSAERLLVDTMTSAFNVRDQRAPATDLGRWLEGRMVRQFLSGASRASSVVRAPGEERLNATFEGLGADTLFAAAAALPDRPRAAVWVVLLRRRTYEEACEVLEVDRDVLHELLGYRDLLMGEVLQGSRRGDGTAVMRTEER